MHWLHNDISKLWNCTFPFNLSRNCRYLWRGINYLQANNINYARMKHEKFIAIKKSSKNSLDYFKNSVITCFSYCSSTRITFSIYVQENFFLIKSSYKIPRGSFRKCSPNMVVPAMQIFQANYITTYRVHYSI